MRISVVKGLDYRSTEYLDEMRNYLNNLKNRTDAEAVKEAREGLIRTGVLDSNGQKKDKIVSWE